jgi:putative hemolysin
MFYGSRQIVGKIKQHGLRTAAFLPFRIKRKTAKNTLKIYGRMGNLDVRLAQSRKDLLRAQKLRYEVFYEEMDAIPDAATMSSRRDEDSYDAFCDHLLVVDHDKITAKNPFSRKKRPQVVGTYRVLRQQVAKQKGGFYSQSEYDIAPLIAAKSHSHQFMELGRSCVMKPYRNRRAVELLWQGIWNYVQEHNVDVMIGCASFPGVNPKDHALPLSFLHHFASAPDDWRVRAHDNLYVDMNMMDAANIDAKAALKTMPPLIKGYLRLGAVFGEGAVIDRQFGTTDVLVILPVEFIHDRYCGHFSATGEKASLPLQA